MHALTVCFHTSAYGIELQANDLVESEEEIIKEMNSINNDDILFQTKQERN